MGGTVPPTSRPTTKLPDQPRTARHSRSGAEPYSRRTGGNGADDADDDEDEDDAEDDEDDAGDDAEDAGGAGVTAARLAATLPVTARAGSVAAMTHPQSRSVERLIHADAQTIFDVLADPFQHHLIDGSNMLTGSPHGPGRLSLGSRFTMGMHRGPLPYRSINTVVEFNEPHRIAWATTGEFRGRPFVGNHRWRYELEPRDEGTLVRETYDWSTAIAAKWTIEKTRMPDTYEPAMVATLARLAHLVEG